MQCCPGPGCWLLTEDCLKIKRNKGELQQSVCSGHLVLVENSSNTQSILSELGTDSKHELNTKSLMHDCARSQNLGKAGWGQHGLGDPQGLANWDSRTNMAGDPWDIGTHPAVPSYSDWGWPRTVIRVRHTAVVARQVHGDGASLMSRTDKSYGNKEMQSGWVFMVIYCPKDLVVQFSHCCRLEARNLCWYVVDFTQSLFETYIYFGA